MYVQMCVHTHSDAALQELSIWQRELNSLSLAWGPQITLDMLASHRHLLTSTITGMVSVHHHIWHFYMVPSDQTKFLMLAGQAFD